MISWDKQAGAKLALKRKNKDEACCKDSSTILSQIHPLLASDWHVLFLVDCSDAAVDGDQQEPEDLSRVRVSDCLEHHHPIT